MPNSDVWKSAETDRIGARIAEYRRFCEALEIEKNEYERMIEAARSAS